MKFVARETERHQGVDVGKNLIGKVDKISSICLLVSVGAFDRRCAANRVSR